MYTIEYIDQYMDEKLDKIGSDYFPLPVKFKEFEKATWDFMRENTGFSEATQEISDDLHTLVNTATIGLEQMPWPRLDEYRADHPANYHRLITAKPMYEVSRDNEPGQSRFEDDQQRTLVDNLIIKEIRIVKQGQDQKLERNPNTEPTEQYPILYRDADRFRIKFGSVTQDYSALRVVYYREPRFGNIQVLTSIGVDLPKLSVEKIMDRACSALRFRAGDKDAAPNYQFDQTFGKRRG